ncbi:MAG: hypothetical protein ABF271_12160 [Abyssibacter sp.]|uniref:hypothetical protein n=1 Tax=Abyssibacter sp. TaxID=2320200 RepID=UPI002EB046FB|nr:hypothetical protein [Pseudomonadota bacterium]
MKLIKQAIAAAALTAAMGTAGAADSTQSDLAICFAPSPVGKVTDVIDVTIDALACVVSQLVSAE